MKIAELPYYVQFVFNSSNGDCFSTADPEMFEFIKYADSGNPVNRLEIGHTITFEPEGKSYIIEDIVIRHIVDDTDLHKYGFDMEGCTEMQGEAKEWFFSILVRMKPA